MKNHEADKRQVLFLCTANCYRSRIAEILFNRMAEAAGLGWRAVSRGIAIDIGPRKNANISKYAVEALKARGIDSEDAARPPVQATDEDLARADKVLALDEMEHRKLIEARFSRWIQKVEYWHVEDLDGQSEKDAIAEIKAEINGLVRRLSCRTQERQTSPNQRIEHNQ